MVTADSPGVQLTQPGVPATRLEQILVRPDLDDAALVDDDDLVGTLDRRQPMRDHDRRPPADELARARW